MALLTGKLPAMAAIAIVLGGAGRPLGGEVRRIEAGENRLQAVLVAPAQATAAQIKTFAAERFNAVVLYLDDKTPTQQRRAAARRVQQAGLDLSYWIEVARNPVLADAHPEWMASLQTHPEWRRFFPNFPALASNQVAKTYPWVPVLYAETFEVHQRRVASVLKGMPAGKRIFLNDLQGAPSACGCGNHFCRWTTDYGPIQTATRLPDDAAAKFVEAVGKLMPPAKVIPVWTTECAEHDHPRGAACDGVACYTGRCWREYNAQLTPVATASEKIGVLLPFRDFDRSVSRTGANAEWQRYALRSFTDILPQRDGQAIPQSRLIAVLQGWDVTPEQERVQIRHANEAGTFGFIVARTKIDQSWEPRLMTVSPVKSTRASASGHPAH